MTQDIKDMQTTPSLTLDPFKESAAPEAPVPVAQEEPVMDDSVLSDEERRMAEQFAQQIDLTDSSVILQYGAGTQKEDGRLFRVGPGECENQGSGRGRRTAQQCRTGAEEF